MPGVTHWHSPQFHAYFPTANSYPGIVADILSDAIGCIGFSWIASPACTELEMVGIFFFFCIKQVSSLRNLGPSPFLIQYSARVDFLGEGNTLNKFDIFHRSR